MGIDSDRLGVIGNGAVIFLLVVVGVAAAVVGVGVPRIELDRHVIIGDGAIVFAAVAPDIAATVVRRRVFGIDLDRLIIIGDGAIVLALGVPGIAAAIVRVGVFRVEPDRFVVVGDGAVVVVLVAVAVAAVVEGDREVLVGLPPGLDHLGAAVDLQVGRSLLLVDAPGPRLRQLGLHRRGESGTTERARGRGDYPVRYLHAILPTSPRE